MSALPVGAILAAALMAARIPCDSGEDVDRLIAELGRRGVRLVTNDDDDEVLRAVSEALVALRKDVEWVNPMYYGDDSAKAVRELRAMILGLIDAALAAEPVP